MPKPRPSLLKRQRERRKEEKKSEKRREKQERKLNKDTSGALDISHIKAGPQPLPEWLADGEEAAAETKKKVDAESET